MNFLTSITDKKLLSAGNVTYLVTEQRRAKIFVFRLSLKLRAANRNIAL